MTVNPALVVPEKGMDIIGATLVYSWKMRDFQKTLRYDLNKCIGCGLCKAVCPVNAIETCGTSRINDDCTNCGKCKGYCAIGAIVEEP